MSAREYYEVLELQPFSDGATVDQAYWHLAKAYQSQAVADPRARMLLDELNEAYGVLGTPRLREDYDAHLAELPGNARSGGNARKATQTKKASARGFHVSMPAWNPFSRSKDSGNADLSSEAQQFRRISAEAGSAKRPTTDVADLRASTSQMLERWRNRPANGALPAAQPDMTLVDIFRSEKDLGAHEDPLTSVMEVLKAPRDVLVANIEG